MVSEMGNRATSADVSGGAQGGLHRGPQMRRIEMIRYVDGDIFESGAYALVNPVNTKGVCGKGLALEFAMRFPGNHDSYLRCFHMKGLQPGHLHTWRTLPSSPVEHLIVNFPTKTEWRLPSKIEYIDAGLVTLR